jgi:arsenate reductase
MAVRTTVLFVCVGNSCRSQMAEALARHHAADVIDATSAGISPLGTIADGTRQVLVERGIKMEGQRSKGATDSGVEAAALIVNMTGIPGKALFRPGVPIEDWDVGDPYGEELSVYRRICDEIEGLVLDLAERLRSKQASPES